MNLNLMGKNQIVKNRHFISATNVTERYLNASLKYYYIQKQTLNEVNFWWYVYNIDGNFVQYIFY